MATTSDAGPGYPSPRHSLVPPDPEGRWVAVTAVGCVVFLAFVAGTFVMQFQVFPAADLQRAFRAGSALYESLTSYNDPLETDFWKPARTNARGVVRHDPARAQQGLTLYSSADTQSALLIDMQGHVVHRWDMPYSRVWDTTASVARPVADPFVYLEKARVLPNGDLLALYSAIGATPWGYGLVKLDRSGNVLWKYLGRTHHSFDVDAAGNVYVLAHEISEGDLPSGYGELTKPRIDDFVVKLSPEGIETGRISLIHAFAATSSGRRLRFAPESSNRTGDYLHANSVQVLERPVPGVPESRAGQLLVSLREVDTIAIVDLDAQKIVWTRSGSWLRQHDAEVLPNGNIMLFDNEGATRGTGSSRVIEFEPVTEAIRWSYGDRPDQPLDSMARASQSRLPNGNTLIVESWGGRLIEVTREGDVVWEYVNPVRGGANEEKIPIVSWAQRVDPSTDLTDDFRRTLKLP
jgi:hypothetical protein